MGKKPLKNPKKFDKSEILNFLDSFAALEIIAKYVAP